MERMQTEPNQQSDIVDFANEVRGVILNVEQNARGMKIATQKFDRNREVATTEEADNRGESYAQVMLAIRDLESARMRIGKFIQYRGDGVSIYDKGKS